MTEMTEAQFSCCLRSASGKSSEAARLVLVDGLSIAEAADKTGILPESVRNALVRIRRTHNEILAAYLPK